MSLINCSNPQCQTTVGCICEKQLKPMTTTPKLEPTELESLLKDLSAFFDETKMFTKMKYFHRVCELNRRLKCAMIDDLPRAAPSAGLREALELLQGFLSCPEIADCAPEDKDPETDDLERRARALTLSKED